jgi:hypothetical protein
MTWSSIGISMARAAEKSCRVIWRSEGRVPYWMVRYFPGEFEVLVDLGGD